MLIEPDEADKKNREETHTLRTQLADWAESFAGEDGEHTTLLPGLSVARVSHMTPPTSYLYEPSLAVIIRGSKRVQLGGNTYRYDESRFLLTAVNLPTTTEVLQASEDAPYLSLLMRIDLLAARQLIADVHTSASGKPAAGTAMATGPATPELLEALSRLVALLNKPDDLPYLGALLQREILYRILTSSAGAKFRETVMLGTQSEKTAKAIAWLRDNFTQPVSIETLSRLAGMGTSTLHHHFRAMTSMSPLQYQKQLRLHEARRLLMSEPLDAATTALRVGYESVTQFNREYRRMFGAPPIQDVTPFRTGKSDPRLT